MFNNWTMFQDPRCKIERSGAGKLLLLAPLFTRNGSDFCGVRYLYSSSGNDSLPPSAKTFAGSGEWAATSDTPAGSEEARTFTRVFTDSALGFQPLFLRPTSFISEQSLRRPIYLTVSINPLDLARYTR